MYYVALSRVQNLSSLYLLKFLDENIKVSSAVEEEMCRLRHSANVQLSVPVFYDVTKFQVIYHNVRSLHKHVEDVKRDVLFKNANILAFSETRLKRQIFLLCMKSMATTCIDMMKKKMILMIGLIMDLQYITNTP